MAWSMFNDFVEFYREHRRMRTSETPRSNPREQPLSASVIDLTDHRHLSDQSLPGGNMGRSLMENTSQNSESVIMGHGNVQAATDQINMTVVPAPELDTEKSYPSRSTTGSEPLHHDDERQSSSDSGPSEQYCCLHEEPLSMLEPLRLETSLRSGNCPPDTSAKRDYYELQEERDRIIPKRILCYLKVKFDGKHLSKRIPFSLDWLDDASYEVVNSAAQKRLHASPETINNQVWRTDGVCKLFKKHLEFSSKTLETEDQWAEVLHRIVTEFLTIPGNEFEKFHLEITWTYAAVDVTVVEEKYSKKIADLIDDRMLTNWRKKNFLPQQDLHALMSQNVIEHLIDKDESLIALQHSNHPNGLVFDREQFTRDVAIYHKHLLALCVYEELPLICLWQMLYLKEVPARFPLQDSDRPPAAEKRKFDILIIRQWYFTVYQFPNPTNAKVHCIELNDDDILPIEAYGPVDPIGRGASKVVYEVQIQPGHHRFTADKTSVFALKEFKNGCPFEDFERESTVLRKLVNVPHKHITPHYASWSQAGHFFMLSPLASCNLKVYLKNSQPRPGDSDFVLWELRQLCGLADGLRCIYNLGGYHHDLKGENLLVFEEGGCGGPTLKIADFGSAKIHPRRSGPRDDSNPTSSYYQGTSAYEAPDYLIRGKTSRPYDVWTLGCIFMDMLVWTFESMPSELEIFSDERRQTKGRRHGSDTMFWYVEWDGKYHRTHWKPGVRLRLQGLEDLCNSDNGRAVFTELVLTTKKMLRMDPLVRPKAYEVHNDLERMILWAEEALKAPDWNSQNLSIGVIRSTSKSEASAASDDDGKPVIAPNGHLMGDDIVSVKAPLSTGLKAGQKRLRDGTELIYTGWKENLHLQENGSNKLHVVVDDMDHSLDGKTLVQNNQIERPMYGSHHVSPDWEELADVRAEIASRTALDAHLPLLPHLSIPFKRR